MTNWNEHVDLASGRLSYIRNDGARVTEDGTGRWRAVQPGTGGGWPVVAGHFDTVEAAIAAIEQSEA